MSGTMIRLLAKSGKPAIYLDEHTEDVENALRQICRIWPELPKLLLKAARFHDFGKAADGFQDMLFDNVPWSYRHEVLSAAIFLQCFVLDEADIYRVYLALLSHHKNFLDRDKKVMLDFRHCQSSTNLGSQHWQTKWNELNAIALKATFPRELAKWQFDPNTDSPANKVAEYAYKIRPVFEDLRTALCRGALVASDHLGSSKIGITITGKNITMQALTSYAKKYITGWKEWKGIQVQASQLVGSAVLIAPTGAGKTEAALLWMLNNRKGTRKYARVFYVLPYQVSINAMAERISKIFPDTARHIKRHENDNVAVLHSNTDLAYLQDALKDDLAPERAAKIAIANKDAARKIYCPIKVTTVYQLLDIFFGRKFFEVGLLELTNSLIIFDEIHAYDGHTLGLISVMLEYLQKLNASVFIMTATLPDHLKSTLLEAAGIDLDNNVISLPEDDSLLYEVRRFVIKSESAIEDMVDEIRAMVKAGKKTVVVCNTVQKAVDMREKLIDLEPFLIHSRFTLGDRAKREHKEILESEAHNLIISTQVIEVSLDVSFDVMFTELAPADALLQRFGRVNRHGKPKLFGHCYIACGDLDSSKYIYNKQLLEATRDHIPDQPLTFDTACKWIENVYPNGLPEAEQDKMKQATADFSYLVSELKPMMDQPHFDLEKNLFETEQVIPATYAQEWCDHKEAGRHLEAKQLIVNVNKKVWMAVCQEYGEAAFDKVKFKKTEYKVALFEYETDSENKYDGTGLRLDRSPVPNPLIKNCIIGGDDDE